MGARIWELLRYSFLRVMWGRGEDAEGCGGFCYVGGSGDCVCCGFLGWEWGFWDSGWQPVASLDGGDLQPGASLKGVSGKGGASMAGVEVGVGCEMGGVWGFVGAHGLPPDGVGRAEAFCT